MTGAGDLERFVFAQERVYPAVLQELKAGRKTSHWMWFIFPQMQGLGRTQTSEFYGISSLEEAKDYLVHPILGPRLSECTNLVLDIENKTSEEIFGFPDYLKFRSCMTLFDCAQENENCFRLALDRFYEGQPDEKTLELLAQL